MCGKKQTNKQTKQTEQNKTSKARNVIISDRAKFYSYHIDVTCDLLLSRNMATRNWFVNLNEFFFQHSPSHHSPSGPKDSSIINNVSSSSDKAMGPKCSSCGTVGHNKNSKVCPNYYSAEAVQRREVWFTQLI